MLVEIFELGELWYKYGLVVNIMVSHFTVICTTHGIVSQPFTSYFPCTDMHDLLTLDLLYQLILRTILSSGLSVTSRPNIWNNEQVKFLMT